MRKRIEIEIPDGMPEPSAAIHYLTRAEEILEQQWDQVLGMVETAEDWDKLQQAVSREFRSMQWAIGAAKDLLWSFKAAQAKDSAKNGVKCCAGCMHWDQQTITCTRPQGGYNGEAMEPWMLCDQFERQREVSP